MGNNSSILNGNVVEKRIPVAIQNVTIGILYYQTPFDFDVIVTSSVFELVIWNCNSGRRCEKTIIENGSQISPISFGLVVKRNKDSFISVLRNEIFCYTMKWKKDKKLESSKAQQDEELKAEGVVLIRELLFSKKGLNVHFHPNNFWLIGDGGKDVLFGSYDFEGSKSKGTKNKSSNRRSLLKILSLEKKEISGVVVNIEFTEIKISKKWERSICFLKCRDNRNSIAMFDYRKPGVLKLFKPPFTVISSVDLVCEYDTFYDLKTNKELLLVLHSGFGTKRVVIHSIEMRRFGRYSTVKSISFFKQLDVSLSNSIFTMKVFECNRYVIFGERESISIFSFDVKSIGLMNNILNISKPSKSFPLKMKKIVTVPTHSNQSEEHIEVLSVDPGNSVKILRLSQKFGYIFTIRGLPLSSFYSQSFDSRKYRQIRNSRLDSGDKKERILFLLDIIFDLIQGDSEYNHQKNIGFENVENIFFILKLKEKKRIFCFRSFL